MNGGLEDYKNNRVQGWPLAETPGTISFVDTKVFHGGRSSLRFENFAANEHGHGRLMQEVAVKPHRLYRFTCWAKTRDLTPSRAAAMSW